MKLSIVYNTKCNKLREDSYSQSYRDMYLALINRFEEVQYVTEPKEITGDVVIIYDIHSTHHIDIPKQEKLTYTYFNDPWQPEEKGTYEYGSLDKFYKLGAEQRVKRALERGVDFIICPYTAMYWRFIAPHLGKDAEKMFVWYPVCTDIRRYKDNKRPLVERKCEVLATGHLWKGMPGFRPYRTRRWSFAQECVEKHLHTMGDGKTPSGLDFQRFLSEYAGALAMCDMFTCPKYLEIPAAGTVCFAMSDLDYLNMGFKDGESCIFINRGNFHKVIGDFKADVGAYQNIADAGRKLIEDKWNSQAFADHIYHHAEEHL